MRTTTEDLTARFLAEDEADALAQARAWIANEPKVVVVSYGTPEPAGVWAWTVPITAELVA